MNVDSAIVLEKDLQPLEYHISIGSGGHGEHAIFNDKAWILKSCTRSIVNKSYPVLDNSFLSTKESEVIKFLPLKPVIIPRSNW